MHDRGRRLGRSLCGVVPIGHGRFARGLARGRGLGHRRIRGGDDRFGRRRLDRRRRVDGRRGRRTHVVHGLRLRRIRCGWVRLDCRRWRRRVSGRVVAGRHGRRRNRVHVGGRVLDTGHGLAHREESEGIDVAVVIGGPADAEVDGALRADRRHYVPLGNRRRGPDVERAEVRERNGIAVGCAQAQRQPVTGCRSRVCDNAAHGRENGLAGVTADLDASALAAGVRVSGIEREGAEHRAADRPRPGARSRRHQEQRGDACHRQRPKQVPDAPRTSPSPTLRPHACLLHSLSIRLT